MNPLAVLPADFAPNGESSWPVQHALYVLVRELRATCQPACLPLSLSPCCPSPSGSLPPSVPLYLASFFLDAIMSIFLTQRGREALHMTTRRPLQGTC